MKVNIRSNNPTPGGTEIWISFDDGNGAELTRVEGERLHTQLGDALAQLHATSNPLRDALAVGLKKPPPTKPSAEKTAVKKRK